MKKLLVLFALMAFAIGAWAAPITYSGQLTIGWTANDKDWHNSYANAYLWLTGTVSEDTLAKVKFAANFRNLAGGFPASLSEYFVSQNIGKFIGLSGDNSLWVDMGVKDMVSVSFPPSDFSLENVSNYDPGAMDTVALRGKFGTLNINAWTNPMGTLGTAWNADTNRSRGAVNVWVPIGPLTPSIWYASNGQTADKGKFGTSIGFSQAVGDIGLSGDFEATYDLSMDGQDAQLVYALAGAASYGIIGIGSEFAGNKAGLYVVAVEFRLTPVKWFGLNIGTEFDLRPNAAELFDSTEFGGWLSWQDGLKFRFGYLYTKTGGNGYSMYCPNPLVDGGLFLKANLSF